MCDEVMPKTQHRPISIKINGIVIPRNITLRRRYNHEKTGWLNYANYMDKDIAKITPTTKNDDTFVNLVRASHRNIPVVAAQAMHVNERCMETIRNVSHEIHSETRGNLEMSYNMRSHYQMDSIREFSYLEAGNLD